VISGNKIIIALTMGKRQLPETSESWSAKAKGETK